jgi:DNA repair ATPase RecN
VLKNIVTRPYSLPKEDNQTRLLEVTVVIKQEKSYYSQKMRNMNDTFENKINAYIMEYTGKCHECKSKLEELGRNLKVSHDRLMELKKGWQEQKNEHQAIFSDSEKVLVDYEQLKSDPQKFEEEYHSKIEARVNPMLDQLHNLCKEMDNLVKTIEEDPNKIIKIEKEIITSGM